MENYCEIGYNLIPFGSKIHMKGVDNFYLQLYLEDTVYIFNVFKV